ncbi:MAG: Rrf2 family transcriptional regulator [Actinomycetota bacterium]|nr:Rrf2 family transcriptional regulator [Actinomycetota bacterium]
MNLSLSRRGDYVVRAAMCLATAHGSGRLCTLRQVSEEMTVPRTFVPQILSDLVRSGLAISTPGAHGGYRLARPPSEVRLLEVVEAGEGPLVFSGCVRGDHPCSGRAVCPLQETWTEASARLRSSLGSTTLADLVRRDQAQPAPAAPDQAQPAPAAPSQAQPAPAAPSQAQPAPSQAVGATGAYAPPVPGRPSGHPEHSERRERGVPAGAAPRTSSRNRSSSWSSGSGRVRPRAVATAATLKTAP